MDELKLREILLEVVDHQAELWRKDIAKLRRHLLISWLDRLLLILVWFLGGIVLGHMSALGG